ncbi:MAG TPA: hypothetical protein VE620_11290 [Myxococcales bacterium]|jgi:hypothetical protein|nr:hypothetical protein [Myxococcales bacterium]
MASNSRNLVRSSLLAGLVVGSVLVSVPARAAPVTPERALLNRVDPDGATTQAKTRPSASAANDRTAIDGEAALLNRRPVPGDALTNRARGGGTAIVSASRLSGATAILGHSI